jgi:hypothetical protein
MFTLEENIKLGAYYLGDSRRPIYNKLHALELSNALNSQVHWEFNDEVYSQLDWKTEPEVDIDQLYRLRAQQLRDKYDYIRLNYSGGVDSTNILYAFLKNNIHIDEVIVRHPESGLRDVDINTQTTDVRNTMSEFEYAVKPRLQWIHDNYPQVKIVIHDYFESMINEKVDESWIYLARDFFHPGIIKRYSNLSLLEHRRLQETGKSIAVVYGIDKPSIFYHDNRYYAYFSDIPANTAIPENNEYTNITTEFFYWTPDFPEIVHKQAHMLKHWYMKNTQYLQLIDPKEIVVGEKRSFVERGIIAPVVYPSVEQDLFQAAKPDSAISSEFDCWFYDRHMNTDIGRVWRSGIDLLVKKFDVNMRKDENGVAQGLKKMTSRWYEI